MAFISMVIAGFFLLLFVGSFLTLLATVAVHIVFSIKGKKDKLLGKMKYVCIAVEVVCAIPVLVMLGLLAFYFGRQTKIPKDFIPCEQITFTDDGFLSASGEEFLTLPFSSHYGLREAEKQAVYSYCPQGVFHRYEYKNIYRVQGDGFSIYCYQSEFYNHAFVKKADYDTACNYYNTYYEWEDYYTYSAGTLTDEVKQIFNSYWEKDNAILLGHSYDFSAKAISNDKFFEVKRVYLTLREDGLVDIATQTSYKDYYSFYGFTLTQEESDAVLYSLKEPN